MSMYNYPGGATTTALIASASCANTAAATSAAFDVRAYDAPLLITQNHGAGTGTLDGKIQDCDTVGGTYADVAGLTFTQSTTTADIQQMVLDPKRVRGFIKYVGTIVTGPHLLGVSIAGIKKNV